MDYNSMLDTQNHINKIQFIIGEKIKNNYINIYVMHKYYIISQWCLSKFAAVYKYSTKSLY